MNCTSRLSVVASYARMASLPAGPFAPQMYVSLRQIYIRNVSEIAGASLTLPELLLNVQKTKHAG